MQGALGPIQPDLIVGASPQACMYAAFDAGWDAVQNLGEYMLKTRGGKMHVKHAGIVLTADKAWRTNRRPSGYVSLLSNSAAHHTL